MRRREFLAVLAGATVPPIARPLAARAQKPERVRRIAVLMGNAESDPLGQARVGAMRDALHELGWSEGRNLKIDLCWSGGDADRLTASPPSMPIAKPWSKAA